MGSGVHPPPWPPDRLSQPRAMLGMAAGQVLVSARRTGMAGAGALRCVLGEGRCCAAVDGCCAWRAGGAGFGLGGMSRSGD
jgi:hypothetical protein